MALIVWDIDEVVANLRDIVCAEVAPCFGVSADWREWQDYQGFYRYLAAETPEAVIDALIRLRAIERCAPEPGAAAALLACAAMGHDNVAVTARGWHPRGREATLEWLEGIGAGGAVRDVVVVPTYGSKVEAIAALGGAGMYVEDTAHHVASVLDAGAAKRAALVDRPWNRGWSAGARAARRVASAAEVPGLVSALLAA